MFRLPLCGSLAAMLLLALIYHDVVAAVPLRSRALQSPVRHPQVPPPQLDPMERNKAIAAAKSAGLMPPYKVTRIPAGVLLNGFDIQALIASERAELRTELGTLCSRMDGSPLQPCPIRAGTQFGVLRAKQGGCVWSPSLFGIPTLRDKMDGPPIHLAGLRCGVGNEWDRIQRSSIPRL